MKGLRGSWFLRIWRSVYAASNPGLAKDSWEVDGVDWSRERHGYWGTETSFQFEIHRLVRRSGPKTLWSLLVVIERWWGPDRSREIRGTEWCKVLAGRSADILAWLKRQVPE